MKNADRSLSEPVAAARGEAPTGRPIVLDDFVRQSPPGAPPWLGASFHADGHWIACQRPRDDSDWCDLYLFDRRTQQGYVALNGEAERAAAGSMTLGEALARERARQRHDGITHHRWVPGAAATLSVIGSRLLLLDVERRSVERIDLGDHVAGVSIHPRGDQVVCVVGSDLWRLPLDAAAGRFGTPRRLTRNGSPTLTHGIADQITREEVYNETACCWAPDGRRLLYASFDAGEVEAIAITDGLQSGLETARYSRPGRPVATFAVSLLDLDTDGANGAASGAANEADEGGVASRELLPADPAWPYLRGFVVRDAGHVIVVRLSRDQQRLQLLDLPLDGGAVSILLEQQQAPWINAPDRPSFRKADGGFFLVHEEAGLARIGLHAPDGRRVRDDIGAQAGQVEAVLGADAQGDGVLFIASSPDARERHLYSAAPADDWACRRLTEAPGVHAVTPAPDGQARLHLHEAADAAPVLRLERSDGSVEYTVPARAARGYEARLVAPRFVDVLAADGRTPLHAAVYDDGVRGGAPRPVLLHVYGGPHAQAVRNAWSTTADLRTQYLAQQGYIVVKIDNRGTGNRGHAFETPLARRLGHVEVEDQCAALQQILAGLPEADPARIGVCGWSYGGYMTLRCLQQRPDLFKAGAAGAPVVEWEDYDAPYTERYMGTPTPHPHYAEVNDAGYRAASVLRGGPPIEQPLLLIHGMNDENVLLRHSAKLVERLAAERRPYELLLLPGERHGVRSAVQRPYVEQRIAAFFRRTLGSA